MVQQGKVRTSARFLLALIYLLAGVAHLRSPAGFLQITPEWVPFPEHIIFITGVCEIAGAAALAFVPKLRRAAGIALALYALCVYPANIKHALEGIAVGGAQMSWWYHAPRLAFQPIFIWWALWAGSVTNWPFARKPLT